MAMPAVEKSVLFRNSFLGATVLRGSFEGAKDLALDRVVEVGNLG